MIDELSARLAATERHADPDALIALGCDLADAGRHSDAESCFRRATESGSTVAWFDLGNSLRELGRSLEAIDALQTAADLGDADAPLNLASLLDEVGGRDQDVLDALRLAHERGDPRGAHWLGLRYRHQGDAVAAEAWLRVAAETSDDAAGDLAVHLALVGSDEDVEPLLRRSAPVNEDARADLGKLLWRTGRVSEAFDVLNEGAAKREAGAMIVFANLLEELDDTWAAEIILRRAIEIGELHAYNNLGTLLRDQGQLLEAQHILEIGAARGDARARENLARLRTDYRRQLNRAHRRDRRIHSPAKG
jgi:tetratricopeptide (TPR) repeat protein